MQIDWTGDDLTAKNMESISLVESRNLVQAPLGLFPKPWPLSVIASEGCKFFKVVEYFRLAGRVIAKALQDGRLLDLPLSMAFYKLILGQVSMKTSLGQIHSIFSYLIFPCSLSSFSKEKQYTPL
jgi:E3 ubiquitin-protein ligase TRIP12